VQVNPHKGVPTWGELTESAAQTIFWTVRILPTTLSTGMTGNVV
jgi:hypothetical protein